MKWTLKSTIKLIKQYSWQSMFFRYCRELLIFIGIPFFLLSLTVYIYFNGNMNTEISSNVTSAFNQAGNYVSNAFDEASKTYNTLITDSDVISYLNSGELGGSLLKPGNSSTVRTELSRLVYMSNYIDSIYLYSFKNNYVLSTKNGNYIENFTNNEWYTFYEKNKYEYYLVPYGKKASDKEIISVCHTVLSADDPSGILVINIKPDVLRLNSENFSDTDYTSFSLYLFDSDFNQISQTPDAAPFEALKLKASEIRPDTVSADKKAGIVTYAKPIDSYGLFLVISSKSDRYNNLAKQVNIIFVICLITAVLLPVVISLYISMRFFFSIMDIVTIFTAATDTISPNDAEKNELEFISRNIMQLMNKNKSIEKELAFRMLSLKKSQIAMLQMQINPHFLFNSLNLINLCTHSKNDRENTASKITVLLSDILAFALDTTKYIIPIRDEISYVKKYIEIENIKYKNSFDVYWDIDERTLNYKTPKFILQPIVENAFKHGILPLEKKKRGYVTISVGLCGEEIHIEIKNNGARIEPQKLAEMQNSLKQNYIPESTHIGLLNVNSRIKLIFSDDYGCDIDSNENETTVSIKFPIIEDNP